MSVAVIVGRSSSLEQRLAIFEGWWYLSYHKVTMHLRMYIYIHVHVHVLLSFMLLLHKVWNLHDYTDSRQLAYILMANSYLKFLVAFPIYKEFPVTCM